MLSETVAYLEAICGVFDSKTKLFSFNFQSNDYLPGPEIKPNTLRDQLATFSTPSSPFSRKMPITGAVIFSIQIFDSNSLRSSYAVTGVGSKNK